MATVMTCYNPLVMNHAGVFSVMLHCNGQYSTTDPPKFAIVIRMQSWTCL